MLRDGNRVYSNSLRCPDGCRFRWSTEEIRGWEEEASALSDWVTTTRLPAPAPSSQRLEIKLGTRFVDANKAEWKQQLGDEMSAALGGTGVDVVEVRSEGQYAIVDVPRSVQPAAEVEVCDQADANNPLLRGSLTSVVDRSAGLLELAGGSDVLQLAPALLPLVAPGRDAAWRRPAAEDGLFSQGLSSLLLPVLGGLVVLGLLLCVLRCVCCSRRSFARVSRSEGPDSPIDFEDDAIFEDEGDVEDGPRFVGKGSVPVTFERSDGSTVSSSVNLAGVTSMQQIFSAVKTAATKAIGVPVEHLSLQYMNENRQFEEAWYDPILREGSDLSSVARARQWRVLILGEAAELAAPTRTSAAAEDGELITVAL